MLLFNISNSYILTTMQVLPAITDNMNYINIKTHNPTVPILKIIYTVTTYERVYGEACGIMTINKQFITFRKIDNVDLNNLVPGNYDSYLYMIMPTFYHDDYDSDIPDTKYIINKIMVVDQDQYHEDMLVSMFYE
jgi:hypothetical protein